VSESLEAITARLEQLAAELAQDPDSDRAAQLVKEASELAASAGEQVDSALRTAAEARDS
jgi:hypothetical protein